MEAQLQGLATQLQQMQQGLEAQQLRTQQLESVLIASNERIDRADEERSALIRALGNQSAREIVDGKGVGQPFNLSGKRDSDFSEWSHKVLTFLTAKYGDRADAMLRWASRQRRMVRQTADVNTRQVSYDEEISQADVGELVNQLKKMVSQIYTFMVSFTTGRANKGVRDAGAGEGLEAWQRLHNEYDPSSSVRRVTILGQVQNPPKCEKMEELGPALEEWLSKKRQYEEFTDKEGNNCRVADDSLMAAMFKLTPRSLEETVMFKADDYEKFEDLFDRLVTFASTKHSLKLDTGGAGSSGGAGGRSRARDSDAMEVDALGKGKGGKSRDRMTNAQCWVCGQYGHYARDCKYNQTHQKKGKGKGEDKGKGKGKDKGSK